MDSAEEQKFALVAIVHYHLTKSRNAGKKKIARQTIATEAGLRLVATAELKEENPEVSEPSEDDVNLRARRMLDNFLGAGGTQGTAEIKAYYRTIVSRAEFKNEAPRHIKLAIEIVYGELPPEVPAEQKKPHPSSLVSVFTGLRYKDRDERRSFGENYAGVWDLLRYSAHVEANASTGNLPDGTIDARAVRASLQIVPVDRDKGLFDPSFTINYRPEGVLHPAFRVTTGSIMLVNRGHHFMMVGREHDTNCPLIVMASVSSERVDAFQGIILRRHEKGQLIVGRAAFIRSTATELADVVDKIGIGLESQLIARSTDIPNIEGQLELVRNGVANGGKCALVL